MRTKIRCEQLYRTLRDRGMNVKALHGDMTQGARDGVMISFKDGRLPLLVATDVAARGLDISGVSHVINYDVPTSPDVYVHRIGRTGRVGRSGRAITFFEPRQRREMRAIENNAGVKLAPWVEDAHVAPDPGQGQAAPPLQAARLGRRRRPGAQADRLAGRAAGLEPSDIIHAITAATGLDGEAVRNVRVLERFTLLEVPEQDADRVVDRGQRHRGVRPAAAARARRRLTGLRLATPAPPTPSGLCQLRRRPPRLARGRCVPSESTAAGC